MISLITIPNLAKMPNNELVKCVVFSLTMDFVILLACINL
jgi:hypothetical protein